MNKTKIHKKEIISLFIICLVYSISSIMGLKSYTDYQYYQEKTKKLRKELQLLKENIKKIQKLADIKIKPPQKTKIFVKIPLTKENIKDLIDTLYKENSKYTFFFIKRIKIKKECQKTNNCQTILNLEGEEIEF